MGAKNAKRVLAAFVKQVAVLIAVVILMSGNALASMKATVFTDSMKVYTKPSVSSKYMGSLKEGTAFTITDYNSTWAKIYYKGYTGYTKLSNVELVNRIKAYTTTDVPVYKYASASSTKLGTVKRGTLAYVAGRSGDYFMVQNKSGSICGYIHKDYLSKTKPANISSSNSSTSSGSSSSSSSSTSSDSRTKMPSNLKSTTSSYKSSYSNSQKIEYIIYVAQNQLGKRYSTNPSAPKTYDCAGLVRYCYNQAKVTVPASAYSQGYSDDFERIDSISDLKRGDMVCFNTNDTDNDLCDHTGIYIGSGKFIHASSGAGLVIVSDLTSGYYNRNFSWGLRILD